MNSLQRLGSFRNHIYRILGNGRDALFDLMDAVLTSRHVSSFVELSLSPAFRRKWSSTYEALQDGHPPRQDLMKVYATELSEQQITVLAGDHTAWSRLHAETLAERTYEHQAQAGIEGSVVTFGQGYSTLAWIPEDSGSWALPLLHERILPSESPIGKAATQLHQVCAQLFGEVIYLGDSEYGCAPFLKQTAELNCHKLLRLRPNRVLYQAPPPYAGRGRPTEHGERFALKQPETWSPPQVDQQLTDPKLGQLRIRQWSALHLKQAPEHPFTLIRVERLEIPQAKPLWLIWYSPNNAAPGNNVWNRYLRRFAIEHWYRLLRQRLHWTVPHLATPAQMETWSDLMPLLTWQLWLAKEVVSDQPLPWQKPMTRLSPGRIADSFTSLLLRIGSPAPDPKPRGKSPGWTPGKVRTKRIRYPVVKKRPKFTTKSSSKAAA
jgi:DDE superfamily endonuclease